MLRKHIPDIRYLRSTLPQAVKQMNNLDPWRPVSHQPAAKRDISLMVTGAVDEEILGDRARTCLGPQASSLESLTIVSVTPGEALPAAAHARMGSSPDQTNVLVRLQLRDLDRSLTSAEANELRDVIYEALHEGTIYEY